MTRRVAVVTSGRADYGILLPVLRKIVGDPELALHLMVTGMHLAPEFGASESEIRKDGFEVGDRIEGLVSSDTAEGTAKSMGLTTLGFAQALGRARPDVLLVVGDRFEIHAGVAAAVPYRIPVAHIHGGEVTAGATDELFRHSITKMSHLHFVATQRYAERVAQMGEEGWRIHITGAPGLDNIVEMRVPGPASLGERFDLDLGRSTVLVTYHPATLGREDGEAVLQELLAAVRELDLQAIITYPNADSGGRSLIEKVGAFARDYRRARLVTNASQAVYIGLMRCVGAMLGNSSSGIIEALSFGLPVVNVGPRQEGRLRGANVIDVGGDRAAIAGGLRRALAPAWRQRLQGVANPYGDGRASERIVAVLRSVVLDHALLAKKFCDRPVGGAVADGGAD